MSGFAPILAQSGLGTTGLSALPVSASTERLSEAGPEKDSPEARKLRKSAQDFEAILVSSWWQEMQNSFRDPDTDQDAGSDTMEQLGFQSMASAMAASGGIGLARMVFHKLAPALGRGNPADAATDGLERTNDKL